MHHTFSSGFLCRHSTTMAWTFHTLLEEVYLRQWFRNSPSYFSIIGQDRINTVVIISVQEVEVSDVFAPPRSRCRRACLQSCDVTLTLVSLCFGYRTPEGVGGGVLNNCLYINREAPPRGPIPYPSIYNLSRKRYPFGIHSIDKWYPFHIPCLELCIPFNCCKRTVF